MLRRENGITMRDAMSKTDFEGLMICEVKANNDPKGEGRISVSVPKVMPKPQGAGRPDGQPVDISVEGRNSGGLPDGKYTASTSMWIRPLFPVTPGKGGSYRVPKLGQRVLMFYLDGDPQKGYYFPFNPTINGEVVNFSGSMAGNSVLNDVIREYDDGAILEYDEGSGTLHFNKGGTDIKADAGQIVLTAGGTTMTIGSGGVQVQGSINASGSVIDGGGNTNHHSH